MSVRFAIIENEFFALEKLKSAISGLRPDYNLVFTSESVQECIGFFNKRPPVDLIFMDIELVDGNCFEILSQAEIKAPVIFTTAYDNYALQAFCVDAVDYLLKPISEEKLKISIEKFESRSIKPANEIDIELLKKLTGQKKYARRILTARGDSYSFIDVEDIAYFYAEDKYVFISKFNGEKTLTLYSSISRIEEDLDPAVFFRLSRKIMANIRSIKSVTKQFKGRLKVELTGNVSEIISSSRKTDFLRWLGRCG